MNSCDVVSTLLGELKSRRVSLALQLLDDLTPVQADRVQLQQVLLNLLTNAIDSMASITDRPQVSANARALASRNRVPTKVIVRTLLDGEQRYNQDGKRLGI